MKLIVEFPPWSSSLLGPKIFLKTLFPKTLNLYSSFKVKDQVLHTYSTTGEITRLYILTFGSLCESGGKKNDSKHSLN